MAERVLRAGPLPERQLLQRSGSSHSTVDGSTRSVAAARDPQDLDVVPREIAGVLRHGRRGLAARRSCPGCSSTG